MSERKNSKRVILCGQTPGPAAPITKGAGAPAKPYIYLLSPADATGRRAAMLFNPRAKFELAERLRTTGISLGEAFSFMSSLYFRGKLAYAGTFSQTVSGISGTLVITPCRGLMRPETQVRLSELAEIVGERIVHHNSKYRDPLERDLRALSEAIGQQFRVVLLGSIATKKYVPLLLEILGERLLVPRAFIGLGNMSRGGLLLRSSRERSELDYVSAEWVLSGHHAGRLVEPKTQA
jgi:hypothetical protein